MKNSKKKYQKVVTFLNFIVAFVQANFLVEFASKEVSQIILTNALRAQMIKPTLKNMQLYLLLKLLISMN